MSGCKKRFTVPFAQNKKSLRLFCFPFAGGSSEAYISIAKALIGVVELHLAQLPGRGRRFQDPCHESIHSIVEDMARCQGNFEKPYALFGHSMGAVVAFELARAQRTRGALEPELLIVSGAAAPHMASTAPQIHALPETEFLAEIRKFGGTQDEFFNEPKLLKLFLPVLRADFKANETYVFRNSAPLACPIVALGGADDPQVGSNGLAAWSDLTTGPCDVHTLPGGHFFLFQRHHLFVDIAAKHLRLAAALSNRDSAGAHLRVATELTQATRVEEESLS